MTACRPLACCCVRLVALVALALLGACAGDRDPAVREPSFYRNMAETGAQLDAPIAASMISGYRTNNGLTTVSIDPELMNLAQAQGQAMPSRVNAHPSAVRSS